MASHDLSVFQEVLEQMLEKLATLEKRQDEMQLVQQTYLRALPPSIPSSGFNYSFANPGLQAITSLPQPPASLGLDLLPRYLPTPGESVVTAIAPVTTRNRTVLMHPDGMTTLGTIEEEVVVDPFTGAKRYETTMRKQYSLDGRLLTPSDTTYMCSNCNTAPWIKVNFCTVCDVPLCPYCTMFSDRSGGSRGSPEPRCNRHYSWNFNPPQPPTPGEQR
jgi:hypothetical protein